MALPNQQAVDYPSFRLLIIGDRGTGKTALVKRLVTGDFERNYEPTTRAETHMLDFHTNRGKFCFTCLDVAAEDNYLRQLHYIKAECAIIMFDVTARLTYNNVPTWYHDLCRRCDNIPIVLCGNKVNSTMKMRHVQTNPFKFPRINVLRYFEISVKSNYNLEKPFLYLARELLRDDKVYFVESPALFPPEVQINMTAQQQHKTEIVGAANQPLPDDDDDDDFDFFYPNRFRF